MTKRNDPDYDGLFHGEEGLWSAVLLVILSEIEKPRDQAGYEQARRIIVEPENSCLPIIAAALGLDTGELQRKIIRRLKKSGHGGKGSPEGCSFSYGKRHEPRP